MKVLKSVRHDPAFGIAPQIVRGEFAHTNFRGELLDDVPDQLFRSSLAPDSTRAAHPPEEAACVNSGGHNPVVQ